MSQCKCCGEAMSQEDMDIHDLIKAIDDAIDTTATGLVAGREVKHLDAQLALEALASTLVSYIDRHYKGHRRSEELKKCERFFREEYTH